LVALLGFVGVVSAQQKQDDGISDKAKELISKMTLEEKVGQMTQITLQVVSKNKSWPDGNTHKLDLEKLDEAIKKYHVGSILNVWDLALDLDEWHNVITTIQDVAIKETRLGIPVVYGIDAIHGANYTQGATLFPQSYGIAATWNTEHAKIEGEITALEVRASGIPWNFNPVLGLGRNPAWPRFWETFGEDPYAASAFGRAYIKGLEGDDNDISQEDRVASCMKHYIGYSVPLSGKDRTPAMIPEQMLRDVLLPPFAEAVKAGSHTIMINSGDVNGIPVHSSEFLLTKVLREELGFTGMIVTDWEDIIRLYDRDRVADSPKEAVRMAVNAGIDMSMVPYNYSFPEHLIELVNEGAVTMERIDEAVGRILTLKEKLGLFKNAYPNKKLRKRFASKESLEAAARAARESITLLKNDNNILPLSKSTKVLVTGPTANMLSPLNGGWTLTWQGDQEAAYPEEKHTVYEAISEKLAGGNVEFAAGSDFHETKGLDDAVKKAAAVDAVVLCLGEPAYCETPGNINDITLPEAQLELAEALIATGKPVVMVLIEGRPRVISRIADKIDGIIMAYLPGMEGAPAIADVIFGDHNPGGKLPFTYPRHTNDLTTYDHKYLEIQGGNSFNPQWEFGHGLSYTTFEYSDLKLDSKVIASGGSIEASITIKNTGQRPGIENVLLFVSDLYRSVTPPVKQLKRFASVPLDAGMSKEITFTINTDDLSFIGRDNKRIIEAGDFKIRIGDQETDFALVMPDQASIKRAAP
ncbi:MAG: glycoside hydrolase family 3 N-terminal domain-containing protein, partial [Calditrichota bacterium]